ncbi:DUF2061 domain-containing protein [Candidatus Woesearchaeota archaeon]|nr:DUF2061 domain-containing protein [Candidatus Woesearchaeota archaeon]
METRTRSLAKSLTYRGLAVIYLLIAVFLFTKKLETAVYVTIAFQLLMVAIYFLHERVWDKISWGQK